MADPEPSVRVVTIDDVIDSKRFKLTISSLESSKEQADRIAREDIDAAWARRKDSVLLSSTAIGVGAIVFACLFLMISSSSSADDKKWATSIVTSIVSASVGFPFGRSNKERS